MYLVETTVISELCIYWKEVWKESTWYEKLPVQNALLGNLVLKAQFKHLTWYLSHDKDLDAILEIKTFFLAFQVKF